MMFLFLIFVQATAPNAIPTENPVRLHHICVQRSVDAFIKSREPATVIADAALTKCEAEFDRAIDWAVTAQTKSLDDKGAVAFARKTTKEELIEMARKDAILRAVEQRSK